MPWRSTATPTPPGALRVRLGRVLQFLRGDGQGAAAGRRRRGRRRSGSWPTRSTRCCGCLHPMIPFRDRGGVAVAGAGGAAAGHRRSWRRRRESIMIAPWPESDPARRDPADRGPFARFQEVLRAVREIRSRQNVPPKKRIEFSVRCDAETAALLRADGAVLRLHGRRRATGWGPESRPRRSAPTRRCRGWRSSSTWPT